MDWPLTVSIASAIAAFWSLLYARSSIRIARKALSLSEQQESRKRPALRPYLEDGYYKKISRLNTKIYGFSVSISNPTDSDNSIVHLEMEISYVNPQNACMKLKIPHQDTLVGDFEAGKIRPISIPTTILAHQTVAGWALFNVSDALLGECSIDSYLLRISDAHGVVTTIEPNLVKEITSV